jgi:hypothetical protein
MTLACTSDPDFRSTATRPFTEGQTRSRETRAPLALAISVATELYAKTWRTRAAMTGRVVSRKTESRL